MIMKKIPIQYKLKESFKAHPGRIALEYGNRHITYGELDKRASRITGWIRDNKVEPGTFIGIYLEDKIELIPVILGILKARCVFVPLDTAHPFNRIAAVIETARVSLVFTDEVYYQQLASHETLIKANTRIITINQVESLYPVNSFSSWTGGNEIAYDSDDKIYVYFTSGTTGTPKGIVGINKSLVHFIQWEIDTFAIDSSFCFSQLSTTGFDAFLRDLFVPLVTGGRLCIPDSRDMIMNSLDLIDWLDTRQIHLIHCVPSIFQIFNTDTLHPGYFKSLKYILLAGEELVPSQLRNWYEKLGERVQLVNLYGTSETTMAKTLYFIQPTDAEREKIPVGKAIKGARIVLFDEAMNICSKGMVGEIYIRTPYRTAGYYNDPQLNAERFIPNPFTDDPGDLLHKTGDLGRILPDGNLEVLGRVDRQVKVRGVRVEPGDIENQLLKHPRVKAAAVVLKSRGTGDGYLCAYIVPLHEAVLAEELRRFLSKLLPDYMIPSNFSLIEKFPLTPNGKIDHRALPAPGIGVEEDYAAPRDNVENTLVELWSEVLEIDKNKISIDSNFFQLGGHSLKATILMTRIHKAFNVDIPLSQVFKTPTIRVLASCIGSAAVNRYISLEIAEKKEYYPLSAAQKRLYIVQQLDPGSTAYNMPSVSSLGETLDMERIEGTLKKLMDRHEILKTSFPLIDGLPFQVIQQQLEADIKYHDLAADQGGHRIEDLTSGFIRPFDLSCAPLLRLGLIKTAENHYLLMTDTHHIITDATSNDILLNDLMQLYRGENLSLLKHQYRDFSQWQTRKILTGEIKKQEEYWLTEFKGEVPVLDLPTDYPRTESTNDEEKRIRFATNPAETEKLKEYAGKENATMYMVALTLLNILLFKITRQQDIVLGSVQAGRRHRDLEEIMGFFVNPLVLRNNPRGDKTFIMFLREVREKTMKAFDNQDYQFEDLVEKLKLEREPGRNPLFDVIFAFTSQYATNMPSPSPQNREKEENGQETNLYQGGTARAAKFDLLFTGSGPWVDRIYFNIRYRTGLFKHETIEKFVEYFKKIVSAVCADEWILLKNIKISHDLDTAASGVYDSGEIEFEF